VPVPKFESTPHPGLDAELMEKKFENLISGEPQILVSNPLRQSVDIKELPSRQIARTRRLSSGSSPAVA
jgi:hypothetical protein